MNRVWICKPLRSPEIDSKECLGWIRSRIQSVLNCRILVRVRSNMNQIRRKASHNNSVIARLLRQCLRKSAAVFLHYFADFLPWAEDMYGYGCMRHFTVIYVLFSTGSLQPMANFKRYHKTVSLMKPQSSEFLLLSRTRTHKLKISRFQRSEWDPYYWTVKSQMKFSYKITKFIRSPFFIRPVFIFNLQTHIRFNGFKLFHFRIC